MTTLHDVNPAYGLFGIKALTDTCTLPTKAFRGDAGFDVYSDEPTFQLKFAQRKKVKLGFSMDLPFGWMALIQEKSGMALADGILTIGNVIDSGYRGEVHAILLCLDSYPVLIKQSQKVAQMIILPCYTGGEYTIKKELSLGSRGINGFGSTGL